jgi:undecaprenyl diphosphate synthase
MKLNLDHLALILDGNRRWGKAHGIKMTVDFYIKGGLLGIDVAQTAFDRGINNLTIWIGSVSNLTERPALEIKALNKAYAKFFADQNNIDFAHKNQVKIDCIGRWRDLLEPATVKAIDKTVAETAKYADSGRHLTVLIGYDGTEERGAALQQILASAGDISLCAGSGVTTPVAMTKPRNDGREGMVRKGNLTERAGNDEILHDYANLLRQNSWTGHLPDVDLIIRTGCGADPHNSAGFLSLIADNSQYAFLDTLWPDFTPGMLNEILDDYAARKRRMGK